VNVAEKSCDQTFISSKSNNGTFHSPNYPQEYPGDVLCKFTFEGQGRERVQIIFTEIALHYAKSTSTLSAPSYPSTDDKPPELVEINNSA
jgi:hypothetical protein